MGRNNRERNQSKPIKVKRVFKKAVSCELDEIDYVIIEEILDNPAITCEQIVKKRFTDDETGIPMMSRLTINKRRRNPKLLEAIREPVLATIELIKKKKIKAMRVMDRGMDCRDMDTAVRAASRILKKELEDPVSISVNIGNYADAWDKHLAE